MKGIIYKVKYVEGIMDMVHGGGYTTNVIHIPALKAEINKQVIREENDDYENVFNDFKPEKVGEVDISKEDANSISIILKLKETTKTLIDKYLDHD